MSQLIESIDRKFSIYVGMFFIWSLFMIITFGMTISQTEPTVSMGYGHHFSQKLSSRAINKMKPFDKIGPIIYFSLLCSLITIESVCLLIACLDQCTLTKTRKIALLVGTITSLLQILISFIFVIFGAIKNWSPTNLVIMGVMGMGFNMIGVVMQVAALKAGEIAKQKVLASVDRNSPNMAKFHHAIIPDDGPLSNQ